MLLIIAAFGIGYFLGRREGLYLGKIKGVSESNKRFQQFNDCTTFI